MKSLALVLCLGAASLPSIATDDAPFIVHAKVMETKEVPRRPPPRDVQNPRTDTPPLWNAVLTVDQVFQGPVDIKGKNMSLVTSNHVPLGNAQSITPKLNVGDVGIFAIQHISTGALIGVYVSPEIEEGVLPLIKGRHAGYEKALQRLSGAVKGMPASSSVRSDGSTSPTNAVPALSGVQAPAPRKTLEATTPIPSEEPASSTPWGIIIVLIAAALGLLWWLLKRRL